MRNFSPEPWRVKVVAVDVVKRLPGEPEKVRGVRIVREAPVLRYFTAQFELV